LILPQRNVFLWSTLLFLTMNFYFLHILLSPFIAH
jgi:hypothetical protein